MSVATEPSTVDRAKDLVVSAQRDAEKLERALSDAAQLGAEVDSLNSEIQTLRRLLDQLGSGGPLETPRNFRVTLKHLTGFTVEVDAVPGAQTYWWEVRTKASSWYRETHQPRYTFEAGEMPSWEFWIAVKAGNGATWSDWLGSVELDDPPALQLPARPVPQPEPGHETDPAEEHGLPWSVREVIDGKRFSATEDLTRSGVLYRNCIFEGMKEKWPRNNGIYARSARGIAIVFCTFRNIKHQGIEGYNCDDWLIEDCYFDQVWEPVHILHWNNLVIRRCLVRRNHRIPFEIQGKGHNFLLEDCWTEQPDQPYRDTFGASIATIPATGVRIRRNTFILDSPVRPGAPLEIDPYLPQYAGQVAQAGMCIEAAGEDCLVEDNVGWGPWSFGISGLSAKSHPPSVITIRGNKLYGLALRHPQFGPFNKDGDTRFIDAGGNVVAPAGQKPIWDGRRVGASGALG